MALDVIVNLPFDMGNYGKVSNTILNGISDPSINQSFGLVAGDEVLLKLYPRDKGSTVGSPTTSHRLQSGFSVRVTGKPLATPGVSSLLFDSTSFTEVLSGSDYYYSGTLDLDMTELLAALGSAANIAVMLVIQITDSTGAVQTYLAPITIFSPYYTGSEGSPSPATPGYLSAVASLLGFIQNAIAITGQTGGAAVAASYATSQGSNADLKCTAFALGAAGNAITIAYVNPMADNAALGVVVTGNAIVVNLATGSGGAITSTASQILAALEASGAAMVLISVALKSGSTGVGIVAAFAAANLTGGAGANIDSILTASGSTPALVGWKIEINDADASRWRLDVGTGSDVNVANLKVVPADYNSGAPLVWTRYA